MLSVHSEDKNFGCPQCKYKAKSQLLITKHVRRLHKKERKHTCNICAKSFFEKWNLTDHIVAVHQKKKPYGWFFYETDQLERPVLLVCTLSQNMWPFQVTLLNCYCFMPCPFTSPKMFCAGPNFLSQRKNLTAFSASSKTFEQAQKTILLNANQLFVWHKMFVTATMCK